jgi:diamine N-acetyltransferase
VKVITLRGITEHNREEVLALRVAPGQEGFVGGSTAAEVLADAEKFPEAKPWYRAIYADDTPVGILMLSWDVEPVPGEIIGPWYLWKLLIDERHQRRGYGAAAVRAVADIVRNEGASELLTSYVTGDGGPRPFYERLGFTPTGELDAEGEVIIRLDLSPDIFSDVVERA